MSKHYTFSDCIEYAYKHNINFNFYYTDDMHYLYADISDGDDGYLTATQAIFEFNNFSKRWNASMNLNIRYAYKKDYELMRRLEIAINHKDAIKHCRATWNHGIMLWYGSLTFNNEHYVSAASVHGNEVWND